MNMKWLKLKWHHFVIVAAVLCSGIARQPASAELHWQNQKKEHLRIRLVALAIAYPRSGYFSSQEVFVAEQEIEKNETRLVKLVYNFLPYQPRLSEYAMEYTTAHEIRATRDPDCDERLNEMGAQGTSKFKYSEDAPTLDLSHQRFRLRCYETTAEDYDAPLH
jgi:hypothetical protein